MLTLYYAAAHLLARDAHRARGGRRRLFDRAHRLRARAQQRSPEYLKVNPKGARAGAGDRSRHPDRDAGHAGLRRAELPRGRTSRRWTIRSPSPRCRRSTAISARTCTSRTPIACAAIAGSMPTTRIRSPPCSARCRSRSAARSRWSSTRCSKGPWVMGERYTICDPYLFTLAQWLEADGVDPKRIPQGHRSSPPHGGAGRRAQGDRGGTRLAPTEQSAAQRVLCLEHPDHGRHGVHASWFEGSPMRARPYDARTRSTSGALNDGVGRRWTCL